MQSARVTLTGHTIDPSQIQDPSEIPPSGAQFEGRSLKGLVDVFCGTLPGDTDALPAAKELLGTAVDTGGLSNADYIYTQVSKLYGGVDLPSFQSPAGNSVKSLVFVSGSDQGGYGAFHIEGNTQADFDRFVLDSLTSSGDYSAGSGLGRAVALTKVKGAVFAPHKGPSDLLGIIHASDQRVAAAKTAQIEEVLRFADQSVAALAAALETRKASTVPRASQPLVHYPNKDEKYNLVRRLVHANQNIIGLTAALAGANGSRQYLSTALFAAELVESFQAVTGNASPGRTDGEAVSRVVAFKLAPEIALIPGFNSGVTQQWWQDGHPDWVNDNSQSDTSADGNGAGVMFLLFLNDYLGIPLDRIIGSMPAAHGAPLGKTYEALLKADPGLAKAAGPDGKSAFKAMVSLLEKHSQRADRSLNLPADGNPFSSMPNAKPGGLFTKPPAPGPDTRSLAQEAQAVLGLESQIEQQLHALQAALARIPDDVSGNVAPAIVEARAMLAAKLASRKDLGPYRPNLPASVVSNLEQEAAPFRAAQYDQSLQQDFWKHVYNELPGSGIHTDRLQVITGTNQAPLAVRITGTITSTAPQRDGDLHITFQPDDPHFPTNLSAAEPPLEVEIIYAGRVTQADAEQAAQGYQNPFDTKPLAPGVRIQIAGPLIYDRAHGRPAPDGINMEYGLEVHPVVALTVLTDSPAPPSPPLPPDGGQLSTDLTSALNQAETLVQTLGNLTALLRKMKQEAPVN